MIPYSRPKLSDLYTLSQSKLLENHTLQSGTYLYSPYMVVPLPPGKTQMFLLERLYFANIDCFDRDSSRFHLTFVAFCLLSVIRKQYLKQCNYSVDQSALLTGFRRDFTTSVWNICRWLPDVPNRETSPVAKSEDKRLFSQANHHIVENCQ